MKIFGVGMNYREHNKELAETLYNVMDTDGAGASPAQAFYDVLANPTIFTKCDSALTRPGNPFFLPSYTKRCDYETEIVLRVGHMGRSIPERWVHRYIDAYTVGIDFTARDLQKTLSQNGLPWDLAKGFDGSAVIGEWKMIDDFDRLQNLNFHLDINGKTVQSGCTSDMIYSVRRIVSYISQFCTLKTGDLIYTGTPVGVGAVSIDDHLEGFIENEKLMEFNVK